MRFLTAKFMGDELKIALALDKAAKEIGVDFIGGYSALVHKSMTEAEKSFILSIPEVLKSIFFAFIILHPFDCLLIQFLDL